MNYTFKPGVIETLTCSADVAVSRFVGGDGDQCGAGARAAGVSMNAAAAGKDYSGILTGVALIELGAAANAGAEIESDANGKGITLASGKANGVLLASGTTGDLRPMVIK